MRRPRSTPSKRASRNCWPSGRSSHYDHLTTAVRKVLTGHTRIEQTAFITFRSHYLCASHFCTVGEGHEKGQVEHGVGYVRRNFLVPIPVVDSFATLNTHLLATCADDRARTVHGQDATIATMWQREQPLLRPHPAHDIAILRRL